MEVLTFARSARRPIVSSEGALVSAGAVRFHHQAGAAARHVGYHGGAPVQLGDGAEIDREGQYHLLTLAQPKIRRLDENARGTEVYRLAQLPATTWNGDVD